MITEEPLQSQGYYYTALALCRQTQFAKAEEYNIKAFLYGDEKWKSKARYLSKQIIELKVLIPQPVNLNDINSLDHQQWAKFWEYDKTNINAGINAVELYIKKDYLLAATALLDDPALANIPGAKQLRKKLGGTKEVVGAEKRQTLAQTFEAQMDRKEYEAARVTIKKALELEPKSSYLLNDLDRVEDEILWKSTMSKGTLEAYEKYLNTYGQKSYIKQAKAKIIDFLKIQIQTFAKRNEVDQAEAAYTKYVQKYTPGSVEKQEFEKILCDLYFSSIYTLSDSKVKADKQATLNLYYKARKICPLSEADKKAIIKLEKSLN